MIGKPYRLKIFFAEIKRRKVARVATVYTVVGLAVIEISDIIGGRFSLSDWLIRLLIIVVIAGFPLAVILAWIYDITSSGIERTEALTSEEKTSLPALTWRPSWLSMILFVIIIGLTVTYCTVPRPNALGYSKQDWVLISDIENNTGDEIFNSSLKHALTVSLDQSKYINIFPGNQVPAVLKRMRMDSIKVITEPVALEIAQREHVKAVLSLTISEVGETYFISTKLIDPLNGKAVRSRSVTVKGKGDILEEMNRLTLKVRKDLGEALNEIHLRTVPLPKATTTSLEALKYLTDGYEAWATGHKDEGLRLMLEAVDLDPDFALAHAHLGSFYYWSNDRSKGEEHFRMALDLKNRLTEREKSSIEVRIERFRGKYDEAIIKYKAMLIKYPEFSGGWFGLGYCYMILNNYEEAIEAFQKSLDIFYDKEPSAFINIAICYRSLGDYQKSVDYYQQAFNLNPVLLTEPNTNREYGFIYAEMDQPQKAREVFSKMENGSDYQQAMGLRSMALLAMYEGKYSEAIEHINESIARYDILNLGLSKFRNRLLLAVMYSTKGMSTEYENELNEAFKVIDNVSQEPYYYLLLGKLCARKGYTEKAEILLQSLSGKIVKGNREDEAAFRQLKGEIEMARGNYMDAIKLFKESVNLREDSYTLSSLADAYYYSGELDEAIAAYRNIISTLYILGWEGQQCSLETFYKLGLIFEEKGKQDEAGKHYSRLLDIWENADNDIPMLIDAKSRLRKLKL
ncbi:MAG: tetratricopeptide repeat protein [Bacteroidales bacterium]|nr:tetratricopeptide repeat protein [Bacteroidales bacterium]